jgi:uncharacterized protein YpmS
MSKRVSTAHLIVTQEAKLIALMAAAIKVTLKGVVDEQLERDRSGDCIDGGNRIDVSGTRSNLSRQINKKLKRARTQDSTYKLESQNISTSTTVVR